MIGYLLVYIYILVYVQMQGNPIGMIYFMKGN
jgi:hypothetical protein